MFQVGPWCSKLVPGVPSWSLVFQVGPWCSKLVPGVPSWSLVFQVGPWCSKLVLGVPSWSLVFQVGPWCCKLVPGAPSCKEKNGFHRTSKACLKKMNAHRLPLNLCRQNKSAKFRNPTNWQNESAKSAEVGRPFFFGGGVALSKSLHTARSLHPQALIPTSPPPPPKIGEEIPTNRRTNWRTNFSAKQASSALDLSPRPQTHLPYGCSIVAIMWKHKISLNFRQKIFVSRYLHGP